MIRVLYIQLKDTPSPEVLLTKLESEVPDIRERYHAYLKTEDGLRFLLGRWLIRQSLQLHNQSGSLKTLKKNKYGKPFLGELPSFEFSISHSGDFVLCASSFHHSMGVDVEQIKPVDFADFKEFIPKNKWEAIIADKQFLRFYDYWTYLESALKADGRGLSVPMSSVEISETHSMIDDQIYHMQRVHLSNEYRCAIAYAGDQQEIKIEKAGMEFR